MANPPDDEKTPAPAETPKTGKRKLLFVVAGIVVLVAVIAIPMLVLTLRKNQVEELSPDAAAVPEGAQSEASLDEDELEEGEEPIGAIVPLDTFVVNLSGGSYIRAQIQVEFVERDIPKRFSTKLVLFRDGIISILAAKSRDDLDSEKGRETLKREIREFMNEALRKEEVKRVYFTQFVIQ